jgi:hypothetical protein
MTFRRNVTGQSPQLSRCENLKTVVFNITQLGAMLNSAMQTARLATCRNRMGVY